MFVPLVLLWSTTSTSSPTCDLMTLYLTTRSFQVPLLLFPRLVSSYLPCTSLLSLPSLLFALILTISTLSCLSDLIVAASDEKQIKIWLEKDKQLVKDDVLSLIDKAVVSEGGGRGERRGGRRGVRKSRAEQRREEKREQRRRGDQKGERRGEEGRGE
eukprot:654562-Hanusia_phi.AAC.3